MLSEVAYLIYLTIRQVFPSLEWLQVTKSVLWNFAIIKVLPFLNNSKDLESSYMMDLNFLDCFVRKTKNCLINEEIQLTLCWVFVYWQSIGKQDTKFHWILVIVLFFSSKLDLKIPGVPVDIINTALQMSLSKFSLFDVYNEYSWHWKSIWDSS